jgi:transcriptional regulator with XRE-family HTH domain
VPSALSLRALSQKPVKTCLTKKTQLALVSKIIQIVLLSSRQKQKISKVGVITMLPMPKSRLKLPPVKFTTDETFGERLARLRKERGLTQVELAEQMGLTQALITSYECDRLRMHAEMLARFSLALEISSDELIGLPNARSKKASDDFHAKTLSLKLVRRLQKIETLSASQQKVLLHTIDVFLRGSDQ